MTPVAQWPNDGEAGFTPGPWYALDQRATTLREQGWTGEHHDAILISAYPPEDITPEHCDGIIARIAFANRPEELGDGNMADAHLIASAPELYEAGERVLRHLNARIDAADPSAVPLFEGIAELHDALAKARGAA
jgi:hypothetical protein